MKNKKLTFIQYSRKSSEAKERQALSIKEQNSECRKIEKREKLKVRHRLQESRSAFKPNNRPEFDRMIELLESGECNAVLTWKPDRLCRNPQEGGYLLQLLQDGVVKEIRCADGDTYTQDSDHLVLQIHFGMANQYSRNLSKNVKRGNYYKFHNKRQWIGPAKPGYMNVTNHDTKEKSIKVDVNRFNLLDKAIRLVLKGTHTPMEAMKVLNEDWGFRTRKTRKQGNRPLSKSSWYKILADPYYFGLMVRSEGEVIGKHKPMLTRDEHDRLQVILGRKGRPRACKHDFAYKKVLKCGGCGGTVTGEEKWQVICSECKTKFHKGKTRHSCPNCNCLIEEMRQPKILHYTYFHCTKRVVKNCTEGSISLANLEKTIVEKLSKFEISEEFRDWAIEHLNELNDKEEIDQTNIKDNLIKELNTIDKAIRNLLSEKIHPDNAEFDEDMQEYYEEEKKKLFMDKKKINKSLAEIDKRQEQWFEKSKEAFDFACTAKYRFETGDAKTKTYILSKLGSNLTIQGRKLHIQGESPYFLIEKGKRQVSEILERLEPEEKAVVSSNLLSHKPVSQALLPS